jgi:hypothetical protein
LHITEHDGDFRRNAATRAGIGNCHEIRTLARSQDADAKFLTAVHALSLQAL